MGVQQEMMGSQMPTHVVLAAGSLGLKSTSTTWFHTAHGETRLTVVGRFS